jgi:hypothetical protein
LGLSRLSFDNISGFAPTFETITYENGFAGVGCNLNSILEDINGDIWIGSNDRVTVLRPKSYQPDTIAPTIQLTKIDLFNEEIPWLDLQSARDTSFMLQNGIPIKDFSFSGLSKWFNIPENLSLIYYNNYLTFSFVGVASNSPKKIKYQYKLEGNDENWSALTSRPDATYGNLPPGRYIFKVKATNTHGYWSNEFNYAFTIRPPWWKTWWAYCLYGAMFTGALFVLYRIQKKRVIEKERDRNRERELAQAKEIEKA